MTSKITNISTNFIKVQIRNTNIIKTDPFYINNYKIINENFEEDLREALVKVQSVAKLDSLEKTLQDLVKMIMIMREKSGEAVKLNFDNNKGDLYIQYTRHGGAPAIDYYINAKPKIYGYELSTNYIKHIGLDNFYDLKMQEIVTNRMQRDIEWFYAFRANRIWEIKYEPLKRTNRIENNILDK